MERWLNKCHFGDCLETLRQMPDCLVQTCVTSPPYFGLRDYKGGPAEIGKEKTPDEFVAALVAVFREVRRVLKDDGCAWINMGDSYGNGKQLLGIPWRLAFALQDDGWILRQEIIWSKPNPIPESVTDRCTKSHESIFLLVKSKKYYFDSGAIKEAAAPASVARWSQDVDSQIGSDRVPGKTNGNMKAVGGSRAKRDSFKRADSKRAEVIPGQSYGTHREDRDESAFDLESRNKRSVWTVATTSYKGAHFATFPPALIEPCILAGAPAGGVVLDCFFGSGTTGQVAQALGRHYIGCELNPAYKLLQDERTAQPSLLLEAA